MRSFVVCLVLLAALPLSAVAADMENGKKLYFGHCAGCHGVSGVNEMTQVPRLNRFEVYTQPDDDLAEVIRSGREAMPAYFGILDDQEILDVINYLRTLR